MGLFPSGNIASMGCAGAGNHGLGKARQGTAIGRIPVLRNPTLQVERQNAISRNPFPIVFSSNVNVGPSAGTTLARGMTYRLSGSYRCPDRSALALGDMQVKYHPTSPGVSVAV